MKDPWGSSQTETQAQSQSRSQPQAIAGGAQDASASAYAGPPGFNPNPATKSSAAVQAIPPRTNSRAESRFKSASASGQGVVIGGSAPGQGGSGLDMQFGSLSFGNGGTSDAPEPR